MKLRVIKAYQRYFVELLNESNDLFDSVNKCDYDDSTQDLGFSFHGEAIEFAMKFEKGLLTKVPTTNIVWEN